jgi:hypothetical protein
MVWGAMGWGLAGCWAGLGQGLPIDRAIEASRLMAGTGSPNDEKHRLTCWLGWQAGWACKNANGNKRSVGLGMVARTASQIEV